MVQVDPEAVVEDRGDVDFTGIEIVGRDVEKSGALVAFKPLVGNGDRHPMVGGLATASPVLEQLAASGRAEIVVTDIINPATYRVDDGIVTVRLAGPGDAPESMRFRLSADGTSMMDIGGTRTWTRRPDSEPVADQSSCART